MLLEFILFLQLFVGIIIYFNIKTFFYNEKYFILYFFFFVLSNFFILYLLINCMYNVVYPTKPEELHLFVHDSKDYGITVVIKNTIQSYLSFWYNPFHYKKAERFVIEFFMVSNSWKYYIFYVCIMANLFLFKLFYFFDTYCGEIPLKQEFPLIFEEHVHFIFFVKHIMLMEFIFTLFYFVRFTHYASEML